MSRAFSARREFWLAFGCSAVFHAIIIFGLLGWTKFAESPPTPVEVEWTWAAPNAGKASDRPKEPTVKGSDSIRTTERPSVSAGGSESASSPAAPRKNAGDSGTMSTAAGSAGSTGSTGAGIPAQARGAAQGSKPTNSTTGRQDIAGGGSSPASIDSSLPDFGESTGYALVPPRLKERPPILLSLDTLPVAGTPQVLLLVEVGEDGRVGKISVNRSSGVKALDDAARDNVARWRFEPAWQPQGKKPVRVMTAVWIRFTREGG